MSKKALETIIPEELISNKIYFIRNQKVKLDRDLATLYEVETKVLKQAVKRNIERFPEDFMFELTKDESEISRSKYKIPTNGFTEQGVAMLSSVLNSKRAIKVNIQIIRLFTKLRTILNDNTELRFNHRVKRVRHRVPLRKKINNRVRIA